jgi:hypothetical protein
MSLPQKSRETDHEGKLADMTNGRMYTPRIVDNTRINLNLK